MTTSDERRLSRVFVAVTSWKSNPVVRKLLWIRRVTARRGWIWFWFLL